MAEIEVLVRDYALRCPPITVAELEARLELNSGDSDRAAGALSDAEVGEVVILHETLTGDRGPSRRSRWQLALVAAAVLAAAMTIGLVVALNGDGAQENTFTDDIEQPPPPEPDPVPPPEESGRPPSVVDSLGYRWSRVPHDDGVFGGAGNDPSMSSVTVGGPGLVAVGSGGWDGLDDYGDAAVWTSVDGLTWSQVARDEVVFGGDGAQEIESVTTGGPGLVAVGRDGVIVPEYGWTRVFSGVAAVWTSVDGLTWSRVPHDEAVFGGEGVQGMSSVTVGGPGLVAVGSVRSVGPDGEVADADAAVWTSVDGLTWSRVLHDESTFGGEGEQRMSSVTIGGPGLVAVGQGSQRSDSPFDSDGFDGDAAVWTSVDGLTWSKVENESLIGVPGLQRMNSVIAGGPGLVAVGFAFSTDAAVWTSVDGLTWSRVSHDEAVFGGVGDQEMFAVTVSDPGLVAVGHAGGAATQGAAVWTSVDGLTWSRVTHDNSMFGGEIHQWAFSVTAGGPGLVAVGSAQSAGDSDLAVMSDQLPEGPSRPGVFVATPQN